MKISVILKGEIASTMMKIACGSISEHDAIAEVLEALAAQVRREKDVSKS